MLTALSSVASNQAEPTEEELKAKSIENIEYLLTKTSEEWQDFESNLFSKNLNESQRQADFKSLYAEELALIQGPPGTGKSTAIAEIIWQHIRKEPKQKIKRVGLLAEYETDKFEFVRDELKAMLKSAIEDEAYEKASRIRDELNNRK